MITIGDARSLPWASGSAQLCVTSPPYWGQRDYDAPNQIGMEATFLDYIEALRQVAREIRRVLRADGVLWLNIGDTYNTRAIIRPSAHQGGLGHDNASIRLSWAEARDRGLVRYSARQPGLKDKDLMGLPFRVANALVEDGWFLRADVIWSKPFKSPEKAYDRPTRMHEYVFMLTSAKHYFFDKHACPEAARSVWEIAPGKGDEHTAVFPAELVRRCVLSSSRKGDVVIDPFAGSGTTVRVAQSLERLAYGLDARRYNKTREQSKRGQR